MMMCGRIIGARITVSTRLFPGTGRRASTKAAGTPSAIARAADDTPTTAERIMAPMYTGLVTTSS